MEDDNWDISAVIKSYDINRTNNVAPNLGLQTFENDDWNSFDKLLAADMTNFNGLSKILSIDFPIAHKEKSDDQVITMDKNDNKQLYLHPIMPTQCSQQIFFPPLPITIACVPPTTITPQKQIDLQQQLDMGANVNTNLTFSMRNPSIQTSIRKKQSIRITYELLQEELTDNIWTWRKYGQKYIKGSPFPRNYYKCSTSKFCEAKKKIEKSSKNESLFLVSYSGEHNHDPPTSRRYPGGNNSSKFKLLKDINIMPKELSLNASSSSSKYTKRLGAIASPINSITPKPEIESQNKIIFTAMENKVGGEQKENVNADIFMGFEKLK